MGSLSTTVTNVDCNWLHECTKLSGNAFYLKLLDENSKPDGQSEVAVKSSVDLDDGKASNFSKMQRLRSSYSKVTSWVFSGKKRASVRRKSLKASRKLASKREERPQIAHHEVPKVSLDDADGNLISLLKQSRLSTENWNYITDLVQDRLTVLFLTPPTDNGNSDRDYLTFKFPKCLDSENIIVKLKGMFITLSQVVNDITAQLPKTTTVSANRKTINSVGVEELIEVNYVVGYVHEFNGTLVVALEESANEKLINANNMLESVCLSIRFLYGSLAAGFKDEANHCEIESLLATLCYYAFESTKLPLVYPPGFVQKLIIDDEELMLGISDALNEYEAMDWMTAQLANYLDHNHNSVSDYIVVGTCLMYKGYLVSSHLPKHNVSDVVNYVQSRGFTDISRSNSIKLVSWLEVYPRQQAHCESLTRDYTLNEGSRFFLLVVCVQHTLLAVLLEMPFVNVQVHIKPDEGIVLHTLRYVTSELNGSGLVDEFEQFRLVQEKFSMSTLSEAEKDKHGSHQGLKTVSLRDIFQASFRSSSKNVLSDASVLGRSVHSLSVTDDSTSTRFHSTPSLVTGSIATSISPSITSDTCHSSSQVSCNETESSCPRSSLASFNMQFHFEKLKRKFPSNLLLYMDVDLNERTLCGPIIHCPSTLKRQTREMLSLFQAACLHLKSQLDVYYPSVSEFGALFSLSSSTAVHHLTVTKVKAKKNFDLERSNNTFWICAYRKSLSRELYACFRLTPSPMSAISMESLAYIIELQAKE
ncbi:Protein inturned [Halotydeus destructor]|nr:Protein inturned [Halotydeus destructor]